MHTPRLFLTILTLAVLAMAGVLHAVPASPSPAPSSSVAPSPTAAPLADIPAKAAEYRDLRRVKGHFGGGEWIDAVDRWAGRKHQLMGDLQTALGDGTHTVAQVEALMGPPDETLGPDSVYWKHERELPAGATRLLVYWWRGRHDFLFFVCVGDRVAGARWFMALE